MPALFGDGASPNSEFASRFLCKSKATEHHSEKTLSKDSDQWLSWRERRSRTRTRVRA